MSPFVLWACPGCETHVTARGAKEVMHQCAKRGNRVTSFKPVPVEAAA